MYEKFYKTPASIGMTKTMKSRHTSGLVQPIYFKIMLCNHLLFLNVVAVVASGLKFLTVISVNNFKFEDGFSK